MNIRVRLEQFYMGKDLVVIVKCPDSGESGGKYIFGNHFVDQKLVALILDSEMTFHPAMAKKYRLHAIGGGHFVVDHDKGLIRIRGQSETYGAEPDRQVTRTALEAALPRFRIIVD